MSRSVRCVAVLSSLLAALAAAPAAAQERASIVGQVQDATGAVLPGVTVEAASPALIERMRSGVTDSTGRFAIIDLRPGTYTVTFALPGFKGFKREGIILEGSFAATVNAALEVGAVEESVVVSAASPVVDLQSTQNQSVLNRQVLDVLPAARTMQGGASLVPGVSFYSQGFTSTMSIHGSVAADQHIFFDGMNIGQNLTQNGQQGNGVSVNELAQQELVYDAGSQSAENPLGGVRMDSIPKEGGNSFSGVARFFGSRGSFQNDNITDELRPFISVGNRLDYNFDANVVLGGPIRQNTLWFLVAQRVSQTNNLIPLPTAYFPQGGDTESGGQVAPRVVHFARSIVLAADAAAVCLAGEMDDAGYGAAAARGGAVARGADLQVQVPARSRPVRHPALQLVDERAHRRVEHGAAGLLQRHLEHRRQPVVCDRIAQRESRPQPAVGV